MRQDDAQAGQQPQWPCKLLWSGEAAFHKIGHDFISGTFFIVFVSEKYEKNGTFGVLTLFSKLIKEVLGEKVSLFLPVISIADSPAARAILLRFLSLF